MPPAKQGDYAYLLHIIRSMKSTGKAPASCPTACSSAAMPRPRSASNFVRSGYLKGIIGLPANLFYGTGIPACIVVLDKENAAARKGVFMIDASKGFIKDGNKNRLREQDIHRIVDTFTKQVDVPRYARMVPLDEIGDPKNDFNLNLPRYIDSTEPEDIQDIDGHLRGGIPERDLDALERVLEGLPACAPSCSSPRAARLFAPEAADRRGQAAIFGHRRVRRVQRRHQWASTSGARPTPPQGLRQGRPSEGADRDHRRGSARRVPDQRRCSMPTTSTST